MGTGSRYRCARILQQGGADFDIFDKAMLTEALEEVLGVHVDVVPDDAHGPAAARAAAEAVPL